MDNNIVDFPVPDRPITEDQIDKLHSEAFRDLEGRLCACVHMAVIARQLAMAVEVDDEDLLFAIGHAAEMVEALKVDYYAAWHNEKPIEP